MNPTNLKSSGRNASASWVLKLFVAPDSAASATAIVQAKYIVAECLPEGSTLEIIDVSREMDATARAQVLAIPTLVRVKPEPVRRIIGDLSEPQKVLTLLGVVPAKRVNISSFTGRGQS